VPTGPDEVLVTGARGFVGRHVIQELAGQGYRVAALDRATCDLTDRKAVHGFFEGKSFSAVMHLAARIPGVGDGTLEDMFHQNMVATHNLLQASRHAGYFVYASTLDVYGVPGDLPITEASPTDPVTAYAITKLAAEKLVQASGAAAGTPYAILRLSHVYGAGDRPIKLIPKTVTRVAGGQPPEVFGDGRDLRDLVHVRDVARAVSAAFRTRARGVFNIAAGQSRSVREVVETIVGVSGRRLEPLHRPRQTSQVDFRFDTARAREMLGFEAREDFAAAIREIYEQDSRG
jgi:nucleoside-diphosphate-sugar epimerase